MLNPKNIEKVVTTLKNHSVIKILPALRQRKLQVPRSTYDQTHSINGLHCFARHADLERSLVQYSQPPGQAFDTSVNGSAYGGPALALVVPKKHCQYHGNGVFQALAISRISCS